MQLLSNKKIRMLELLDKQIQLCTKCDLYKNGRVKPYWTPMSVYVAVGEAPGRDEVEENEPFIGKAGKILGDAMQTKGFRKFQFGFINSVNCRPVNGNKNGKPTKIQIELCKPWIRKFIRIIEPEKIITFGTYAMYQMGGPDQGIVSRNGWVELSNSPFLSGIPLVYSVHPAYSIYKKEEGKKLLEKSIEIFSNIC